MLEITEIDIKEFEDKIYKEYITLFPEEEQRSWDKIRKTYEKGIEKFYKITLDNIIIGFFMLEKEGEKAPYYLDYFAILKKYQNKGYGTEAIKQLLEKILINEELIIEIEKEEELKPLTIKRANFYKKLGFKKVESEYLLYKVLFTPYIYTKKENIDKKAIDEIMFKYYVVNCGEEVKENCKIIKWNLNKLIVGNKTGVE